MKLAHLLTIALLVAAPILATAEDRAPLVDGVNKEQRIQELRELISATKVGAMRETVFSSDSIEDQVRKTTEQFNRYKKEVDYNLELLDLTVADPGELRLKKAKILETMLELEAKYRRYLAKMKQ